MPPKSSEDGKVRRKPGKPITSCAECRRLKLRYDRKVPCANCSAKGCADICPDGSLTPRRQKGILVLSSTAGLHDRLDRLMERAASLESALLSLQPENPLLKPELLSSQEFAEIGPEKQHMGAQLNYFPHLSRPISPSGPLLEGNELHGSGLEEVKLDGSFGTLVMEEEGDSSNFFGGSSRVEHLMYARHSMSAGSLHESPSGKSHLKPRVLATVLTMLNGPADPQLLSDILELVPPQYTATRLCELYLSQFGMIYPTIPRLELFERILGRVYNARKPFEGLGPYALLFNVLSLGAIFDANPTLDELTAHDYHIIALACASQSPTCGRKTSLEDVETLQLTAMYMILAEWGSIPRHDAWIAAGKAMRLAISMGLHLNGDHWDIPIAHRKRRSRIFWMTFLAATHSGFSVGRPPLLPPEFIDCPLPDEPLSPDLDTASFHLWAIKWGIFVQNVQSIAFSCKSATYSMILELDQQLRDFPIPVNLQMKELADLRLEAVNQLLPRILALVTVEASLSLIHKRYLAVALQELPYAILDHKYSASVVSAHRSSQRLIEAMSLFWGLTQTRLILARFDSVWSYVLGAGVTMSNIAIRAPASPFSETALAMLDRLTELFESAPESHFVSCHLNFVHGLRDNAHAVADSLRNGQLDDRAQLLAPDFDRLAGRTHLLCTSPLNDSLAPIPTTQSATHQQEKLDPFFLDMNALDNILAGAMPTEDTIQESHS